VVSRALDRFDGTLEIEPVRIPVDNWQPGFVEWQGKRFRAELRRAVRILPDTHMQGFFICRLRRTMAAH
jgi:16S rRNA (cytosine1407-C5)-methyltransferase